MLLNDSVKYLKGVGPARATILSKLGINTVSDLVTYLPKEYDDRKIFRRIAELGDGDVVTISGTAGPGDVIKLNFKLSVFKVAISDPTGVIYATFYKRTSRRYDVFKKLNKDFARGARVIIHGRIEKFYSLKQIKVDEYELLTGSAEDLLHTNRIVPIYSLTEGLNNKFMRTIVKQALDSCSRMFPEILPLEYRQKNKFIDIKSAIEQIHFPRIFEDINKAREKLAFDEFLLLEIAMLISKKEYSEKKKSHAYSIKRSLLSPFKNNLKFEFTSAQKRVINEIFKDMQAPYCMNRLLMGDVGSGKTVVALSAALLAIENGYQVAFMAPTEILAEQHLYTIRQFLSGIDVKIELMTGSTPARSKKIIMEDLAKGGIDLVIGTHALIEKNIKFSNLSLVIIDEQHKFGVVQRQMLQKDTKPDVLIMTATPIPRTLALTVYGNLEISVIDEKPPGRQPVITYHWDEKNTYEFARKEIKNKHKAYIVFPLVEESDKIELKSAVEQAKRIARNVFPEFRVGLLHGQLPGKEKEKTMIDFRDGKYDILIATTVIEVGIDVPDANVIIIENSDRFGLATLHQLRGRVGRNPDMESYCFLLGEPKSEEARKRIDVMLSTNDGFKIAESDLEIRGAGKFFGLEQSGLSELRVGNIVKDISIIAQARKTAEEIIAQDRLLANNRFSALKSEILKKYGGKFILPQIG